MTAPARVAAYDVSLAVSSGRADLPAAIAHVRSTLKDDRDRALASEIATGTQRWRAALDHLITHFAKRPIARIDPEVVEILRIGAYQLLYLERVPASAVVDDSVELTRRAGKSSAAGFVNAVLRHLSRSRGHLPLPPRPSDESSRDAVLDYLSITMSHPRWLAARWYGRLGFQRTETWMQFNNHPAPLTLRANPFHQSADSLVAELEARDIVVRRGRFAPDSLVVEKGKPLGGDAQEGAFVVQDEASQLVVLLAGDDPGPLVLDTCAAPGGKTTALAAVVRDNGSIVACDVRNRRMALLRRTVRATGAPNVRLVQADLKRGLPFDAIFSCVLVDAPCSGLGTLRRDPDIRWRRQESDLASLASDQRRMIQQAAEATAPGGRLVYATCSSEPEENEQVVDAFLAGRRDFTPVDARRVHPSLPETVIDTRGHLRSEPDRHGLEAFFGAVLERHL